jgi:hypothetical protein
MERIERYHFVFDVTSQDLKNLNDEIINKPIKKLCYLSLGLLGIEVILLICAFLTDMSTTFIILCFFAMGFSFVFGLFNLIILVASKKNQTNLEGIHYDEIFYEDGMSFSYQTKSSQGTGNHTYSDFKHFVKKDKMILLYKKTNELFVIKPELASSTVDLTPENFSPISFEEFLATKVTEMENGKIVKRKKYRN